MKKVAILHSRLSGYSAACQKNLKEKTGVELMVVHWPIAKEAPFGDRIFSHIDHRFDRSKYQVSELKQLVKNFQPDALLISGWMDKGYLSVAKWCKADGIPVIAGADTQWKGNWRQWLASLVSGWYLHTAIDVLWVTGERQRQLAWKLGYRGPKCETGYYACDWTRFASAPDQKRQNAFLYVGRYLPRKGLDVLLDAYELYRKQTRTPWELWTAGAGPLHERIEKTDGVKNLGFIQPEELPSLLKKASAFVLPSRYEPWGVALQEAAAAGLPLIAADTCGAGVHLLADGFNGFSFQADNVKHLSRSLSRLSELTQAERNAMGQASFSLSKQYTPELWAIKFLAIVQQLTTG